MTELAAMPRYEAYKNSGVEWIGEVPAHWNQPQKMKFISSLKGRQGWQGLKASEYTDEGPHILSSAHFNNYKIAWEKCPRVSIERYLKDENIQLRVGDVLLMKDGANMGKLAYVNHLPGLACLNSHLLLFRSLSSNDKPFFQSKFMFYHMMSDKFQDYVKINGTGATFLGISQESIGNYPICLPLLEEQQRIANYLDIESAKIDQAVAIKEKQIALLKERRQILIQNAMTRGLDPQAPVRDSGVEWIGDIPAHWEMHRVKNLFRLIAEPAEKNNDHELLSIYTDIGVKPRKELEEKGNKASTTDGYWLVKKGDFIVNKLLAWMGAIGLSEYEGVTSPAYDILRPSRPLAGMFYHYLFRTKTCSAELKRHSRGIMEMRLRLYFDKFGVVMAPYPPEQEQEAIVEYIGQESTKIDKAITLQQQQIDRLKEYRATLINSAVTGKIKVV